MALKHPTPSQRFRKARDCCQSIVALMKATEQTRRRDDVAVMVSADMWRRIYLNARRGALS
jgi:hypothetical protein